MRYKKMLSIIMVIALVMSASPVAMAAITAGGFPDSSDNEQMHAITYLKAVGILKGDGGTGNFRPNDYLTRQEFAVIISRIAASAAAGDPIPDIDITASARAGDPIPGIDITVNQSPGLPPPPPPPPPPSNSSALPYTDESAIADWARESVDLVTEYGWVKGYQDGSFGPSNHLTFAEAITVLLRVLGYESTIDQADWPAAYIAKSIELELDAGVVSTANTFITRAEMSRLTYNILHIPRLSEQEGILVNTEPLLRDLTDVGHTDKYINGDSIRLYVDAINEEEQNGSIIGFNAIWSTSGKSIDIWKSIKKIRDLLTEIVDESEPASNGSTSAAVQRTADLKKLADELVNLLKQEFEDNSGTLDTPDYDHHAGTAQESALLVGSAQGSAGPAQRIADLKKLADELVNLLNYDIENNDGRADTGLEVSAQRIADLKKLADELVNIYSLAQNVVLIGAGTADELIGKVVKVTFNQDGQVVIIETTES